MTFEPSYPKDSEGHACLAQIVDFEVPVFGLGM